MLFIHEIELVLDDREGHAPLSFDLKYRLMLLLVLVPWITLEEVALAVLSFDVVHEAFLIHHQRD